MMKNSKTKSQLATKTQLKLKSNKLKDGFNQIKMLKLALLKQNKKSLKEFSTQ
jgi:hypothetical protein